MNSPLSERISDYAITATNLLTPRTNWVVLSTNNYDSTGNFIVTNSIGSGKPQQFYQIKQ